ncbi:MAG: hypothetical protein N2171_06705 [Clostridia bacterium]|nr:hypothetical protein [Clostridia bacterium]
MAVKKGLTYKGKPVIRKGNVIFYGNLEDKYILVLTIMETKLEKGVNMATKVRLQLQDNSGELGKGKVYRQTERDNLYRAFDIGSFWLQDALEENR